MKKSKGWIIAIGVPVVMLILAYFALPGNKGYYEILDKYDEESSQGNVSYYYVRVNELDSTKIYKIGDKLFDDVKSALKKNDAMRTAVIVYFYNPKDTTPLPRAMLERIKESDPDNEIIKLKMNYIVSSIIYVAVINQESNTTTIRELHRTMLFVPGDGKKGLDMMRVIGK